MSDSFVTPWTVAYQVPLSVGFSRKEFWSGLPFLSPGDIPDSGIKPRSPTLQADALPSELPGKLQYDPGSIPGSGRSTGEGKGNSFQCSCLENPMDRGVWWATVQGVAKSRRRWQLTLSLIVHLDGASSWKSSPSGSLQTLLMVFYSSAAVKKSEAILILDLLWLTCLVSLFNILETCKIFPLKYHGVVSWKGLFSYILGATWRFEGPLELLLSYSMGAFLLSIFFVSFLELLAIGYWLS